MWVFSKYDGIKNIIINIYYVYMWPAWCMAIFYFDMRTTELSITWGYSREHLCFDGIMAFYLDPYEDFCWCFFFSFLALVCACMCVCVRWAQMQWKCRQNNGIYLALHIFTVVCIQYHVDLISKNILCLIF